MADADRGSAHTLDCRGDHCPMPVLKTRNAIQEIEVGEVLEVVASDRGAVKDIPAWVHHTHHELVSSSTEGPEYRFWVRRLT